MQDELDELTKPVLTTAGTVKRLSKRMLAIKARELIDKYCEELSYKQLATMTNVYVVDHLDYGKMIKDQEIKEKKA